jgi:hypothetical protein
MPQQHVLQLARVLRLRLRVLRPGLPERPVQGRHLLRQEGRRRAVPPTTSAAASTELAALALGTAPIANALVGRVATATTSRAATRAVAGSAKAAVAAARMAHVASAPSTAKTAARAARAPAELQSAEMASTPPSFWLDSERPELDIYA